MTEPPSIAVVITRLDGLVMQISTLTDELRRERESNERRYIPRGEYDERAKGVDRRLGEIEKELDVQAGFRRQVQAALIAGFILILVPVIGTVATFTR